MKKEYMEINGVQFEVVRKHFTQEELASIAYSTKNLESYYVTRPSDIKRAIYKEWIDWSLGVDNLYYFNVSSANGFQFTLMGIIENSTDPTGKGDIVLKITKAHNIAYIVE